MFSYDKKRTTNLITFHFSLFIDVSFLTTQHICFLHDPNLFIVTYVHIICKIIIFFSFNICSCIKINAFNEYVDKFFNSMVTLSKEYRLWYSWTENTSFKIHDYTCVGVIFVFIKDKTIVEYPGKMFTISKFIVLSVQKRPSFLFILSAKKS